MLLFVATPGAQAQSVGVKTDRSYILIGERLQYELMVNLPAPGYAINFKVPDSIPHFDVIENKNFDTITNTNGFLVHKTIILTSFDSGAWQIPSFEVLVQRSNLSSKFNTEPIMVNVGYSPADSTGQLRDIKPVMEVNVIDYFWYYIAAGALLLLILGFFLYRYLKKRAQRPKPIFHSALTAYEEAMKGLNDLKQQELREPASIKSYHTTLADIFRKYYSRRQGKNMMNKTTSDILMNVREHFDDNNLVSSLAEALRSADAIKFAKYIPGSTESNQNLGQVKDAIETIEKDNSNKKQQ